MGILTYQQKYWYPNLSTTLLFGRVNSLTNNNLLDQTKFKAFAENNSNITKLIISLFDRVENIMGKGENAALQHFLLFLQCFQKASFPLFRLGSVSNKEYFHKNKNLENKTTKQNILVQCSVYLILGFRSRASNKNISVEFLWLCTLFFYNYSNAVPECKAN